MAQSFYPFRDEWAASGNFVYWGSAVPTNGDFNVGDVMFVVPTAATASPGTAPIAYRCTVASSAHNGGTWVSIGDGNQVVCSPALAAASANQTIFLADGYGYTVQAASVVVGTVTAGSGTIGLEVATGTQAVGSGTALFTAINPVTGNTPANTVTAITLTSTSVPAGSRINFLTSGTLTSLADVVFSVTLNRN